MEKEDTSTVKPRFRPAFLAFLLLNFCFELILHVPGINPYVYLPFLQNQTAMEAIVNYKNEGIVFLGSSVMEIPLCLMDKRTTYSPTIPAVQAMLAEKLGKAELNSTLLSLDGGQASDQYQVLQQLAQPGHRPRLVILAVVPRDLYDTRFKNSDRGAGFRALAGFSRFSQWHKYLSTPVDYCNAICDKSISLYRFRTLISAELYKQTIEYLQQNGWLKEAPAAKQDDFSRKPSKELMEHSLNEYLAVYKGIENSREFDKQKAFLLDGLQFAKSKNLPVILLNLPLEYSNQQLLPAGFYERYRQSVSECARLTDTSFVDLNRSGLFSLADFWDSGHLGLTGATKLLNYLLPTVKEKIATTDK